MNATEVRLAVDQLRPGGDKQEGKATTKKEVKGNQTRGVRNSLLLQFASVSHTIVRAEANLSRPLQDKRKREREREREKEKRTW